MPIDVDVALNAELDPIEFSWTSSDVQLYHLALGAGSDPMDPRELRYLVDDTPQVLPTFGNVAATFHATKPPTVQFPGIDIELGKVLHASERVEVPAPLPPSGSARAVTRFTDIWDKGKAAVIWSETKVTAPDGTLLWTQKRSIFARGEGGFGGERGPSGVTPRRSGRPTWRSTCRSCRSRRCCTGCAATATRCTRIPNSPLPQGFPSRSCTGCAPTA
ncbi:metal-binding domain of MaoC dehydratase family protein [Mycobacterium avium subsp. avium 2285 (R)]|nr:metal-binding domain of MaoC dehydratase family protein [Mycobacterium avium subsp. avium 2285 (R)]